MKLCFIGTNNIHLSRWIKYFVGKGHEVSLITLYDFSKCPIEGVQIINLDSHDYLNPKNIFKVLKLIVRLKKIIRKLKPEVVHVHQIAELAYLLPFIKYHPYVLTTWGSDLLLRPYISRKYIRTKIYSILASKTIKNADLLHCDGIKTRRALEKFGGSTEKIVSINFGTETDIFKPERRDQRLRDQLGIGNSIMIISTRNLEPIYDIQTLIKSIPMVISKFPDSKFVILGSGQQHEALQKLAADLHVVNNIIFTGKVSISEMPIYLASADIYVSTSLSDAGLAASTAEAMASCIPVIITEDPDNEEWITNGLNGYIIPTKSPIILAERIIELALNKNLRETFGVLSRKIIEERNEYSIEMGKMETKYKSISVNR